MSRGINIKFQIRKKLRNGANSCMQAGHVCVSAMLETRGASPIGGLDIVLLWPRHTSRAVATSRTYSKYHGSNYGLLDACKQSKISIYIVKGLNQNR